MIKNYFTKDTKMTLSICILHGIAFLDLFAVGLIVPLVSSHLRAMGGSHIQVGLLGSIYAGFQLGSGPFMDLFAVGLIVPLVSSHLRAMGGSHIQVGLLGSIYAGFQLGSGPFMGSLSDIKGRKLILTVTLLVSSIAYIAMGITNSIYVILFIRAVLGLFKQTQTLTKAMVPDYEPDRQKQGEIYGKMMAISGAGITLGPVIGGHIIEDNPMNGFSYIAVIVGVCFVINAALVYLMPNAKRKMKRRKEKTETTNLWQIFTCSLKQSFAEIYNIEWSMYWDIFLFKGLIGFAMGVYYSNYSTYLKSVYALSPKYVGYIISFQGVIGSLSSYFMGAINSLYKYDKDYSERNFHVFLMLTMALIGMIMSFNIYVYTFWIIPLAIGNAVGRLITLEMVLNRGGNEHRGTLIGASNSVRSLSGVVSPMVAGVVGEYFGINYVIYASLLSTGLGVVLSYKHKNKRLKTD